jgi:hypothetical protein
MPADLKVACLEGLANRIRVLLSGVALEEATGRRFTLLWPKAAGCAAAYEELFTNPWRVETVEYAAALVLRYVGGYRGAALPNFNLPGDIEPFRTPDWLVPWEPNWLGRWMRHGSPRPITPMERQVQARCAQLMDQLQPVPFVASQVQQFAAAHFRPQMIGVHLRQGDLAAQRPDVTGNWQGVFPLVDRWLAECPDAGIFLCTDDGAVHPSKGLATPTVGVRAAFLSRYGQRVVTTIPRSLDRRDPISIQDALVDLLLLRRTQYFAGTKSSSFSELAALGRTVPKAEVGGPDASSRWMSYTGVNAALVAWGLVRYGRLMPPGAVLYHVKSPARAGRKA